MRKVSKSTQKTGRIWSVVTGLLLVIILLRGQFIDSSGFAPHNRLVSSSGDPLEFYTFVALLLAGFLVSTFFGFIVKREDRER